jgi:hypothetical protein
MTAKEFDDIFQIDIDKNYNAYQSPPQRQLLYKQAFYYALESIYRSGVDQEWTDEIRSMIKVDVPLTLSGNQISIPSGLPDYGHYLFARAEYKANKREFTSFTYSGTGTVQAYSQSVLPYRTGTKVEIANVQEMPEANGTFYLKLIGRTAWGLYADQELSVPVTATVFTATKGDAIEIQQNDCVVQFSDQKIQKLDKPTERNPKIQIADNAIKVYPSGATKIYLDYVSNPPVLPTETNGEFDDTFDLETIYPAKFLYEVIGKAVDIFNTQRMDPRSFQQNIQLEKLNQ